MGKMKHEMSSLITKVGRKKEDFVDLVSRRSGEVESTHQTNRGGACNGGVLLEQKME